MWTVDIASIPGKRWHHQDRHIIRKLANGYMVVVLDGHGEDNRAVDIATESFGEDYGLIEYTDALLETIRTRFDMVAQRTRFCESGTTVLLTFLFDDGSIVSGVLGDSLIIVCEGPDTLYIGPHHNVRTNEAEREAAIVRGGVFRKGMLRNERGGVQVARAFGNGPLYDILSREPEMYVNAVSSEGSWVAMMTDGVIDPAGASMAETCTFARMVREGKTAYAIAEHFYPEKEDDATLVLARWTQSQ